MVKVLREDIADTNDFEVETRGELHLMPRNARMVMAIFGAFERTNNSTLLYSASVESDWQRYYRDKTDLLDSLDSEYLDDLRALREGRIDIIERVAV